MHQRLVVPPIAQAIRKMSLASWTKREGDRIEFGEEVCVLGIGTKAMLTRDAPIRQRVAADATRGSWWRRGSRTPAAESLERRADGVIFRVVASDEGILRRQCVAAGDSITPETLLGLITTSADEPLPAGAATSGPTFRSVAEPDSSDPVAEWDDDLQDDSA
jgi:hypothetical protein